MLISGLHRFSPIRTLFLLCLFVNTPPFFAYPQYTEESIATTKRNASFKRASRPSALLEVIAGNILFTIPVAFLVILFTKSYLDEPLIAPDEPLVDPAGSITSVKIYMNGLEDHTIPIAPIKSDIPRASETEEEPECHMCMNEMNPEDLNMPLISLCGDDRHCCHATCYGPMLLESCGERECDARNYRPILYGDICLVINYQTQAGRSLIKEICWNRTQIANNRNCSSCNRPLSVETQNKIIQQFLYDTYTEFLQPIPSAA